MTCWWCGDRPSAEFDLLGVADSSVGGRLLDGPMLERWWHRLGCGRPILLWRDGVSGQMEPVSPDAVLPGLDLAGRDLAGLDLAALERAAVDPAADEPAAATEPAAADEPAAAEPAAADEPAEGAEHRPVTAPGSPSLAGIELRDRFDPSRRPGGAQVRSRPTGRPTPWPATAANAPREVTVARRAPVTVILDRVAGETKSEPVTPLPPVPPPPVPLVARRASAAVAGRGPAVLPLPPPPPPPPAPLDVVEPGRREP